MRRVWSWLTLLLFISGIVSPRLLAATRPDCPMMQAEQERLCHATPKPEPAKPACCVQHESEIAPTETVSGSCCCDMTSAPEREVVPTILTVISDPVVLPEAIAASPIPRITDTDLSVYLQEDETAPRGPPLRTCSPRAPPLS